MAITFSDNFDSEVEGTSPPVNWSKDGVSPLTILEVDDAQYVSSPHSMLANITAGVSSQWGHTDKSVPDLTPLIMKIMFDNNTSRYYVVLQSTAGDSDTLGNDWGPFLFFQTTGDIFYYNGGVLVDTGYDYVASQWYSLKIIPNYTTNTFDAWLDAIQICSNAPFYNDQTQTASIQIGGKNVGMKMWIDDVQIGEADGWTGKVAGVENPAKVAEIPVENIASVQGVP